MLLNFPLNSTASFQLTFSTGKSAFIEGLGFFFITAIYWFCVIS